MQKYVKDMEVFKYIEGYEGLYQISNYGNVKSLWYGKERILKPSADGNGYLFVNLYKDAKRKHHQVHRLVAQAFIPNPDNLPQVNHKDECKINNSVENLEWCTCEYNLNYGTRNQRAGEALTNGKCSISIDMFTKDGELIHTFPSCMEAERWLRSNGLPKAQNSHIIQCCKGKLQSYYGFKWRYAQKKEATN